LASNFNNDDAPDDNAVDAGRPTETDHEAAHDTSSEGTASESAPSPGMARFRSCRWQQPAEGGNAEFCTHREVKPFAGTTGFDPEAWCPDCEYYKLRRVPKKRPDRTDYSY